MLLQQGDVLINKISKVPKEAKRKEPRERDKAYILAEGEVTGHAHKINAAIDFLELADRLFFKNDAPVIVEHEEHNAITVPAGIWEVTKVREYDHFKEEIREVRD